MNKGLRIGDVVLYEGREHVIETCDGVDTNDRSPFHGQRMWSLRYKEGQGSVHYVSESALTFVRRGGKKVVYIGHPLSAPTREGIEANRAKASRWVAWAAKQGVAPEATWIVLTGQWTEEEGRELGLEIDCALVARCDEIRLCGGRVSSGMQIEREAAEAAGVKVVDLTDLGEEPPKGPYR